MITYILLVIVCVLTVVVALCTVKLVGELEDLKGKVSLLTAGFEICKDQYKLSDKTMRDLFEIVQRLAELDEGISNDVHDTINKILELMKADHKQTKSIIDSLKDICSSMNEEVYEFTSTEDQRMTLLLEHIQELKKEGVNDEAWLPEECKACRSLIMNFESTECMSCKSNPYYIDPDEDMCGSCIYLPGSEACARCGFKDGDDDEDE